MAERENTDNAIPSNALKDLNDNTIILDEWTNSKSDYTQDRFGVKFKTRYKILNDLQTSINNIQSSSFLRLSGGTLTGSVTGTDFTGNNITAKTSLSVGSAKATYGTNGLNFDKPLLISNTPVLKQGDGGIALQTQTATNNINIDTYDFKVGFYSGNNWSSTAGLPFGLSSANVWFYLVNQNLATFGSNYKMQILGLNQSGENKIAVRYKVNGVFTKWAEFITTANIGNYQSTSVTILYPGGSEASPPTILRNTSFRKC